MPEVSSNQKHSFWEFKKYSELEWFRLQSLLLVFIVIAYLAAHIICDIWLGLSINYEYTKLDQEQMQQINRVYNADGSRAAAMAAASVSNDEAVVMVDTLKGAQPRDSARQQPTKKEISNDRVKRAHKALAYIRNEFSGKIDDQQFKEVKIFLDVADPDEAIIFLNHTRFKVHSNFWLIGPAVYWEIVFWSWFGVLCSILFNVSLVIKNSTTDPNNPSSTFDSTEIPAQIAKLLYAPMCTLVIVFGYNFFSNENIVDISSSKGVIVFAFIGGFYSSRLIAFMDRLKELILPANGTQSLPQQVSNLPARTGSLSIALVLDPSIAGDLRAEIMETGLQETDMKLTDQVTGEELTATPVGDDQSALFLAPNVKAGNYILTASWSKEVLGEPVNLKVSKEITVNTDTEKIDVVIGVSDQSG